MNMDQVNENLESQLEWIRQRDPTRKTLEELESATIVEIAILSTCLSVTVGCMISIAISMGVFH